MYTHDFDAWVFDKDNKRSTDLIAATNQFDDVSVEFVDVPTEGKPLNFSRADFAGTFPTAPTEADMTAEDYIKTAHETVYDENTNKETGNVEGSVAYTDKMPTTKANNGIQLISLRGLDYNDPAWDLLLDELDMSTVANMLANAGYNTAELTDIRKPATLDYDGPMGWSTWVSASGKDAICLGFPAEEVLAATWNEALAEEMGQIIGEQGLYNGFNGWYAPAMNTHRNGIATWANEQAIREIYLKPFEVAVKEAKADVNYYDEDGNLQTSTIKAATAIMSSYNRIGCTWSGARYGLMTTILRDEWGFDGAVLTDYYGGSAYMDPDSGIRAGNDLMLNTFADGSLSDQKSATGVAAMRRAAHNTLYMVVNSNAMQGIVPGSTVTYKLATWQKCLIAGDIVAAAIVILGIVLILKKRKTA